ncbi:hypothetical protein ES707_15839 [subsurface metagenome]
MEANLSGGFVGECNIFIRNKLRENGRASGRLERRRQKNPTYFIQYFSVLPRSGLRSGFWVINRLSTTQKYPQWQLYRPLQHQHRTQKRRWDCISVCKYRL